LFSLSHQKPDTTDPSSAIQAIQQHQATARQALVEANYHQALKELDAAKQLSDRHPRVLSDDERFQLEQLHRQCDLLARLLNIPLQEVVKEASRAHDEDWPTRFKDLYQGHSVLFDDLLRADDKGRPMLHTYEVWVGDEKVRLAWEEVRALRNLSLDPPQRVFFGARLAKVAREPGGWVIHFDPDSGVLFTDPEITYCVPLDENLRKVLERQERWLRHQ
jgi:hypothetical protein